MKNSDGAKKPKIFYGWYIMAGLATVSMISVGMGGLNFGLFIPAIHEELHINHAYFGWGQTARLVGFGLTSWYIGRMLDRHGARIPMAVAGTLMGLIMIGLSRIQAGWHLVALFFAIGVIGLEGAGGNLFQSVPLSRWFIRLRGKAMSRTFLGYTAGMLIFTPLIQYMIATTGWRLTWVILGGGGCLLIVIIALTVIRKDPQSMGLEPDGDVADDPTGTGPGAGKRLPLAEYSWTRSQAIRCSAFWILVVVSGLRMFSISTINMFRIPWFIEQGLSGPMVAWAIASEAVISALIAGPTGWAVDRFKARNVATVSLALFILVFFATMKVSNVWQLYLATGLFGVSAASFNIAQNALWPSYFGGLHIGAIRGIAVPLAMCFSALGGPITGAIRDATGTYNLAWILAAIVLTVSTVLLFFSREPLPPVQAATQTGVPSP